MLVPLIILLLGLRLVLSASVVLVDNDGSEQLGHRNSHVMVASNPGRRIRNSSGVGEEKERGIWFRGKWTKQNDWWRICLCVPVLSLATFVDVSLFIYLSQRKICSGRFTH